MTSTHHIHKHGKIDEPKSLAARQADVARERELHNIAREWELDLWELDLRSFNQGKLDIIKRLWPYTDDLNRNGFRMLLVKLKAETEGGGSIDLLNRLC